MKDEDEIELIGSEARREEQLSELEQSLAAYAASTLPPERVAELTERAAAEPELARALAAHRPLAAAEKQRIAGALKAMVSAESGRLEQPAEGVRARVPPGLAGGPARARWLNWMLGLGVPMLAAAAFALLVLGGPDSSLDPLGRYALEVQGTVSEQRGAPAAEPASTGAEELKSVLLLPGQVPVFALRPESRVVGPVTVLVWLVGPGDEFRPLAHELERAASGALRITLRRADALPQRGSAWVLLARPEIAKNPDDALPLLQGGAASGPGWQRWRIDFRR
jgi:hypothetical protein